MRRLVRLVLPATLALAACETPATAPTAAAGPPSRAVYYNDTQRQIAFSGSNDCTGELLSGTGNVHTVVTYTTDATGGIHSAYQQQYTNLKLTGSFGSSYVGNQTLSDVVNYNSGATAEAYTTTVKLIGQGRTPNDVLHVVGHLTFDANGVATSYFDRATLTCN